MTVQPTTPTAATWKPFNNGTATPTAHDLALAPTRAAEVARLTTSDRQLLSAAAGDAFEPVADGMTRGISSLGILISTARESGELRAGQRVTAEFLRDLADQYRNDASIQEVLGRGISFLQGSSNGQFIDFDA